MADRPAADRLRGCASLIVIAVVAACGDGTPPPEDAGLAGWAAGVPLPEPVANNAVAALAGADGCTLMTATGIDGSLAASGIHARAWTLAPGAAAWTPLPDAPGPARIAASAVGLRGRVYVIGGYSVAPGGAETTHDTVAVWDAIAGWTTAAPMPVPVDDAVAVAWRDRWIVVVSGWSSSAPVAAVQIYDAETAAWAQATPFPGTPVFGHAGALVGDELVVIDGVASRPTGFAIVAQAWHAALDPIRPTEIAWTLLAAHPGPPRYRAAAGAVDGHFVFHGGTDTPYNYDGLRYDTGQPARPLADSIAFDPALGRFVEPPLPKPESTMDHRGLVGCRDVHTVGGLVEGPAVTGAVWTLRP